jgi:hypothetical protein
MREPARSFTVGIAGRYLCEAWLASDRGSVGKAEAASPALRKDLRLQSENEELIWLFEYGMNAIRYDLIWDKKS